MARRKKGDNQVAVGNITRVSGKVTIAGGDIYEGYTAEQVSLLLTQITTKYQRKPFDGRCPYKGLEVFEDEDADLFFGRERLIEDLVNRVKESRTVFITGPSGSGKSSLVRAGLIHALKQAAIKGSNHWLYETMKPGREPLKDLALAFSRLKGPDLADYFQAHVSETDILNKCAESVLSGHKDQRFVLFVDQFEEVFTQVGQEERVAFLAMLAQAGTVENGRVIVLFAMRSDFVSNCATYPQLNALLNKEFVQIGSMQPEELVSAIALPAIHVGLPVEDELIARIINDMKGEPGALPLMQFALKDLFDAQQAKGGMIALRREDYLRHGGIQKSLERHADNSFAKLSESEQQLAYSIFSGLVEVGRGTVDTRRIAAFEELVPANVKSDDVGIVIQKLADARLIITDEQAGKDTVTISHEKLIEAWPWLKKLVNENRDAIALQNEIANDATEWDKHQKDQSYLYVGARLANVCEQLEAKKIRLSDLSQTFVNASQEVEQAEQQRKEQRRQKEIEDARKLAEAEAQRAELEKQRAGAERQRAEEQKAFGEKQRTFAKNLRIALIGAVVAFIIAAFLGFLSWQQSNIARKNAAKAQQQAEIARAGELAAQSISQRDKQFDLSLLLSLEAFHTKDIIQTRSALLDTTYANSALLGYFSGHSNVVSSVSFSPDGTTLASGSADNTIILWNVDTRRAIGQPLEGHSEPIYSVTFSPDGKTLASGSADNTIILWNVDTRRAIGQPLEGHKDGVRSVAFSPDGKTLASAGFDGTIILWDVDNHRAIGQPLEGHKDAVDTVAFSPDGKTLASGSSDNTIILWDVDNHRAIGQPLEGHSEPVYSVAFSPDGKTLASAGFDSTIILWDVDNHRAIGQPLEGHSDPIYSVSFSPDGKTLASGSADSTIILWDVDNHRAIGQPLQANSNVVWSVAFSPDGKTLASGSADSTIILWEVDTRQAIGQSLEGHNDAVWSVAFSPDGKTLASGSLDHTIILWDLNRHQPISQLSKGIGDTVPSIAFSPDGKTLASAGFDSTIILWDVDNHRAIGQPLEGHKDAVRSLAFSPDGKTLASGSSDNTIILWDVDNHRAIGQPLEGHSEPVYSVAFSPDGKTLASAGFDSTIILWDVDNHRAIGQPLEGHIKTIWSVAFSPDGKTLASGSDDNTIILWDVNRHKPIGPSLKGHRAAVWSVAFSPDGKTLASGSFDGTIILWDLNSHQPINQLRKGYPDAVWSVAFSPDGKILASGGFDRLVFLWDLRPELWIKISCQRAGRNFTRAEWAQYFPNEEYRKTCEQWPLDPEPKVVPSPTP